MTIIYGKVPFIEKKKTPFTNPFFSPLLIPLFLPPLLFLLSLIFFGFSYPFKALGSFRELVLVREVYDGDTVLVESSSGIQEILRYAGIDTPEVHHPRVPQEELGHLAWEYNRELVRGRKLEMELEGSGRDRYGRLLGSLLLPIPGSSRKIPVQEVLLREGLGMPRYGSSADSRHKSFQEAFEDARAHGRGLWKMGTRRIFTPSQAWKALPYLRGRFVTLRCTPGTWKEGPSRTLVSTEDPRVFLAFSPGETCNDLPEILAGLSGKPHLFLGKIIVSYEGILLSLHHPCQIF